MDSKTQEQVKRQATLRPAMSKQLSGNVPGARAPEVKTGHGPTARGFEPLRAEPNGFLVHHLSHSVTLSWTWMDDLPAGLSATANVATQGSMGGASRQSLWPLSSCRTPPTQGHQQGAAAADDTWPLVTACTHRAGAQQDGQRHRSGTAEAALCLACWFDSEGIRAPAGRAQWISSPSP